jgi:hypothetical protein
LLAISILLPEENSANRDGTLASMNEKLDFLY